MTHALLERDSGTLDGPLLALWHDAHGNWEQAHATAQEGSDRDSAWVHAYLHRKEGDQWNAEYWYRRAGQPVFDGTLQDEWQGIVTALSTDALTTAARDPR